MDGKTYIDELFDIRFIKKYEYTSKELFKKYVRKNIEMKLHLFSNIVDKENIFEYEKKATKLEKSLINILEKCYKRTVLIRHNNLNMEEMDSIAYDIVHEKIMIDSIDNIILLEEINYLSNRSDIVEILNIAYFYVLEIEIYKYFDIFSFNWKNNNNKNYIKDKIKCLFIQKQYYKKEMISKISNKNYKENLYEYKKFVGLLSTFSITEIYNKTYDLSTINDIYKIKYLLTVNDRDNLYIEKDGQIKKRIEEKRRYKLFAQDMLTKYKKLIEKKDSNINKLEKENSLLQEENDIKQNTIMNYANCINEYNNLSWINKLKNIFKKDNIKLLS